MNFNFTRKEVILLALLGLVVLLSRLPFLDAGYGAHADGWRVADTARLLAEKGEYRFSRTPGFPLHELACAAVWPLGASGINGVSALAGAIAAVLLAIYGRSIGCRDYLLLGLAMGFAPAFFVSSVSAKDFTMTQAFLLGSLIAASRSKPGWAGLWLGLAAGCRSTSAMYGIPLAVLVIERAAAPLRRRSFLQFFGVASAIAVLCYGPIVAAFYDTMWHLNAPLGYPSPGVVATRGTLEVWGLLGLIGLGAGLIGVALARWDRRRLASIAAPVNPHEPAIWSGTLLLTVAFYLWLPDQAGYLVMAIPMALLLLARLSWRPFFQATCLLIILSPFFSWKEGKWAAGLIVEDRRERLATINNVRGLIAYCRGLPAKSVVVVGAFEPRISLLEPGSQTAQQRYVYLLSATQLREFIQDGWTIFYTPEMRAFEMKVYGIDLARYGAINLQEHFEKGRPR